MHFVPSSLNDRNKQKDFKKREDLHKEAWSLIQFINSEYEPRHQIKFNNILEIFGLTSQNIKNRCMLTFQKYSDSQDAKLSTELPFAFEYKQKKTKEKRIVVMTPNGGYEKRFFDGDGRNIGSLVYDRNGNIIRDKSDSKLLSI
jgi:hypothetical protein